MLPSPPRVSGPRLSLIPQGRRDWSIHGIWGYRVEWVGAIMSGCLLLLLFLSTRGWGADQTAVHTGICRHAFDFGPSPET